VALARVIPLSALTFARRNRSRHLSQLKDFVRIPSVSADPGRRNEVERCAAWLAKCLERAGLETEVTPTSGHPIVRAQWVHARDRPTVLIYGHYDVQPPGAASEWRSPPFEPIVRGGNLFGRGASDDKGQLFAHVSALESILRATGRLPVNVLCVFEGEEEIGSPSLLARLAYDPSKFGADLAVVSDAPGLGADCPAITYGLRGMLTLELEVRRPGGDVHSGIFGGAVPDAMQTLCSVIASLQDQSGRVAVPGFLDRVVIPGLRERAFMARMGPSDTDILRIAGVDQTIGEPGFTVYEQTTILPALTVTRISDERAGSVSSIARATIDIRLVAEQRPDEIETLFRRHVAASAPIWARARVSARARVPPVTVDRSHPAMHAAAEAYVRGFRIEPSFLRLGGTIPIVSGLHHYLGIPVLMMGFALMDDRMHAPNEKFHLPNFFRGIETSIWFLSKAGAISARAA